MSKYLYNGVELPALPEWDKTTYPYAAISYSPIIEKYHLFLSTVSIMILDDKFTFKKSGSFLDYQAVPSDTVWEYKHESVCGSYLNMGEPKELVWSSHDLRGDYLYGATLFKGSEPIPIEPDPEPEPEPEEPEEPETVFTARDLYRKINGKPTKLTLYKKLGGKLIPLDEHTKEVKT